MRKDGQLTHNIRTWVLLRHTGDGGDGTLHILSVSVGRHPLPAQNPPWHAIASNELFSSYQAAEVGPDSVLLGLGFPLSAKDFERVCSVCGDHQSSPLQKETATKTHMHWLAKGLTIPEPKIGYQMGGSSLLGVS